MKITSVFCESAKVEPVYDFLPYAFLFIAGLAGVQLFRLFKICSPKWEHMALNELKQQHGLMVATCMLQAVTFFSYRELNSMTLALFALLAYYMEVYLFLRVNRQWLVVNL